MAETFADDWWSGNRYFLEGGIGCGIAKVRYGSNFDRGRWTEALPTTLALDTRHGSVPYRAAPCHTAT